MGELAALGTSIMWSLTSIQFTLAGRRASSAIVNRVRLLLAVVFLALAHVVLYRQFWPASADLTRWSWLGLSGVVGLVLGDASLFQAFVLIGPRRSMLVMTLAPVIGALIAWLWLGETLSPAEIAAIVVTIGGIAWVVGERRARSGIRSAPVEDRRSYALGLLLALGGAAGQAAGLVLSKQGLADDFPPLSATLMRMLVAAAAIWLLAVLQRQAGVTGRAMRDRRTFLLVVGGALSGPAIGVWLSMVAVQQTAVGVASALMSLAPVILIPIEARLFGERITPRAVAGTIVALSGASLLVLATA